MIGHILGESAVRWRKKCEDFRHDRTSLEVRVIRKNVARDRRVCGGIIQLRAGQQRRKVTFSESLIRQTQYIVTARSKTEALVGKEEESFVFPVVEMRDPDGTSGGGTEVILSINSLFVARRVVFPAIGVKYAIAEIVVS